MIFSSHWFLFAFLPTCLGSYYLAPKSWRNAVLLFWSYLFYAWGAPKIVLLLLASSFADYLISHRFSRGRFWLPLGIIINLGTLAYFKYANFFVSEISELVGASWTLEIALPIGISFFTFQKISYLVDVATGRTSPAGSFLTYGLYVALFPQLIAGPIIRYHDVSEQLVEREHSIETMAYGIYRFCIGLGKKVLIADILGAVADNVFGLPLARLGMETAWLGALCYSIQIYFDFSGYSDMAIGLGYMFGFRFEENFRNPYISRSITEFWRRWHISLSSWMREYLYIPLGGNRISSSRTYANLWIVFLLSGLWHGSNWTFIFWGAYHGLFLVLERAFWGRMLQRWSSLLTIPLTFLIVLVSWVFFRADNLTQAMQFLSVMTDFHKFGATAYPSIEIIDRRAQFTLGLALVFSFLPAVNFVDHFLQRVRSLTTLCWHFRMGLAIACLLLSTTAIAAGNYSPFLYFRF